MRRRRRRMRRREAEKEELNMRDEMKDKGRRKKPTEEGKTGR
jgi:hypothetical protein